MPTLIQKSVFDAIGISDHIVVDSYPDQVGLTFADPVAVSDRTVVRIYPPALVDTVAAADYIPHTWRFITDNTTLSDVVSIIVAHRGFTDQIGSIDRVIRHLSPSAIVDSATVGDALAVGPKVFADIVAVQEVVEISVSRKVTDTIGVVDAESALKTEGGEVSTAIHMVDTLAVQDVLSVNVDLLGVHAEDQAGIDDWVMAGATVSGVTSYAVVIDDSVGISAPLLVNPAAQKTVQVADSVAAAERPVRHITITYGTPILVEIHLAEPIGVSDVGSGSSLHTISSTTGITDAVGFGLGLPDTVGVSEYVKVLPDKVIVQQPDSFLETYRKPRTDLPALRRDPTEITYRGIALPTAVNPYPSIKEEFDLIRDSIVTILLTKKGQRLFVPDFGAGLWQLVFEPNDVVTQGYARELVRTALAGWEPRVLLREVGAQSNEHTLTIFVSVLVRRVNQILNLRIDISRDTFTFQSIESSVQEAA